MNALLPILAAAKQQFSIVSLLPLIILGGAMYMLFVVPNRKQKQKHAQFVSSLKVGDSVVTSGGIHGVVVFVDDTTVDVEVDTDVVLKVSKPSLARFEAPGGGSDASDDETPQDSAGPADESPKKK